MSLLLVFFFLCESHPNGSNKKKKKRGKKIHNCAKKWIIQELSSHCDIGRNSPEIKKKNIEKK